MIELLWVILIVLGGLFFVPIVAYLTARMGSYGWLKGRYLFRMDHKSNRKGKVHGNEA